MIPIGELWPFTVYRWYGVCTRSLWCCFWEAFIKTVIFTCCFFPLSVISHTWLFPDSSKPSPQPLILPLSFLFPLFNHLSSHLYLLSLWFIFSAGWTVLFHFSPNRPIPLAPSQSLLLQFDSPLRQPGHQGRWTVYKWWGSLSLFLIPLPSFLQPNLFVRTQHMQSQSLPYLTNTPQTISPSLPSNAATILSTERSAALVPYVQWASHSTRWVQ